MADTFGALSQSEEMAVGEALAIRNARYVKGVQFMVENNVTQVPDAYIQPPHKRPYLTFNLELPSEIPVIDLARLKDRRCEVVQEIRNASCRWGFFQVINHEVPLRVIEGMMDVSRRFHELPTHQKMVYYSDQSDSLLRFQTSFTKKQAVLEWRDILSQTCHPPPPDEQWLKHPPDFRDVAGEYGKEVQKLAKLLLALLSEGLKVSSDTLEKALGEEFVERFLINYYPPCPRPELVIGVNPHSDPGGLTVLLQDEIGGLQVLNEGNWLEVKPLKNAFVINIADQLEVLSNGIYKSVEHRAIRRTGENARVSVATFFYPKPEAKIGPLPQLTISEPPLYKDFLFRDFYRHFFSEHYDGKRCLEKFKLTTKHPRSTAYLKT